MRILMAAAVVLAAFGAGTAQAQQQDTSIPARVDRLEREMRAVQRKIFPGGAGATVEPQITAELDTTVPGAPSTSPVADLTQRVAAVESQLAVLTGQVEQLQNRERQTEEALGATRASLEARIKVLEDRASAVGATASTASGPTEVPAEASIETPAPTPKPAATPPAAPKPTSARAAQLAAIERPKTDDPAEDGYVYGFRLWQAKLYPESRKALTEVVANYPKHRRASFAQNLLGRAYLDAGAPSLAAVAFYENYKKNPNGERAPDSLYYLAKALVALKKPATEVCKVYTELTQLYGERLNAEMKAGVAQGRAANKCQ
jgi:TolA-binding protein